MFMRYIQFISLFVAFILTQSTVISAGEKIFGKEIKDQAEVFFH